MEITKWDRFWMSFKLYQLWCFLVLNLRILWGVSHSKRLPRFVIEYKVSYSDDEARYRLHNCDGGHRLL